MSQNVRNVRFIQNVRFECGIIIMQTLAKPMDARIFFVSVPAGSIAEFLKRLCSMGNSAVHSKNQRRTRTSKQLTRRVSTVDTFFYAVLAQLEERWSPKPEVEGSTPSNGAICVSCKGAAQIAGHLAAKVPDAAAPEKNSHVRELNVRVLLIFLSGNKYRNMTEKFYKWLCGLIASGDVHPFYCSSQWVTLSHKVLDMDKHECQICKEHGRYRRADLVHHVNHVRHAPAMALDIWFTDADGNRRRNLISVCKDCHETVCHPERLRKSGSSRPLTPERWD